MASKECCTRSAGIALAQRGSLVIATKKGSVGAYQNGIANNGGPSWAGESRLLGLATGRCIDEIYVDATAVAMIVRPLFI